MPSASRPCLSLGIASSYPLADDFGFSGQFLIDVEVLRDAGTTDFVGYAVEVGQPLLPDLFLD